MLLKKIHKFANPNKFLKVIYPFKKISLYMAVFLLFIGLMDALLFSPQTTNKVKLFE